MKKNIFTFLILIILLTSCFNNHISTPEKKVTKIENNKIEIGKIDYNNITNLINNQKFGEAIKILKKEYKKNPKNIKNNLNYSLAVLNMASITKKEKIYGKAIIKILNYTLKLDPKNSEVYRLLGYSNEIMENYNEAFKNYNKSIELNPNNYLAYGNRGHTYGLIGDIDNEKKDLLRAYKINNKIDQVIINLARVYLGKGNIEEAKNYFNKTIEISKNNRFKAEALYSLGVFSLNEKQFKKAKEKFILSIKNDPNFEIGYIGLAREQFELFIFQAKQNKADTSLVNNAIKNLKTAINLNSNKTTAYYYLALLNMDIGIHSEAKENFKKALEVLNKDITLSKIEKNTMKILINKYNKNATNK